MTIVGSRPFTRDGEAFRARHLARSMAPRMKGKHVVVTGASSGIGRALAVAFGAEGATVWLGARRERELAETARAVEDAGGAGHLAKHVVELCLLPDSMFVDEVTVWPWAMYTE